MLVDVGQILESESILDHWEFQVIISSTTEASIPYLCQDELLEVTKPSNHGCAEFVVQTESHPDIASYMVEVQVRKPRHPRDIKKFVKKLIESMQERASRAREGTKKGPDGAYLKALEGLRVWAGPNNTQTDVKCVLAVSMLKGTLALLRYGHGFDRWANKNPLWGANGEGEMFQDVVIDMFDALTWNNLRLPTFVKDATPRFIT